MSCRKHGPYRKGKVHVQAKMCATCIFHPGNVMDLREGRVEQMVAEAGETGCIPCHETIAAWTGKRRNMQAVCRGYFEMHRNNILQIAERLGYVEFV